ncbi:MAG: hypothetical protein U9Q37_00820, partial [Euryarchaeota archaeon]|nr:hypothetical protein [Euryarchaeota archaeon]
RKPKEKKQIGQYDHRNASRANNPPVGLVTPETDRDAGKKTYAYNPHLYPSLQFDTHRSQIEKIIDDALAAETIEEAKAALAELKKCQAPYLDWAGKAEHTSFDIPTVSLHAHERIDLFATFQFDPGAAKDIDETDWPGVTLSKAQMNADPLTEDLKKKRASNESFWLIGQPDVNVERITEGEDEGKYRVEVPGFDYYNTKTGTIDSGGTKKIAVWMLDTDYDERSPYPRQVFFPMAGAKDGWARLAKNLKAEVDPELVEAYRGTISLPFEVGGNGQIVDYRGIESLEIVAVE